MRTVLSLKVMIIILYQVDRKIKFTANNLKYVCILNVRNDSRK